MSSSTGRDPLGGRMGTLVNFWKQECHSEGDHLGSLLTAILLLRPVGVLRLSLSVDGTGGGEEELTFTSLYCPPGSVFGISHMGHVTLRCNPQSLYIIIPFPERKTEYSESLNSFPKSHS